MVSPSTILSGLSFALTAKDRQDRKELRDDVEGILQGQQSDDNKTGDDTELPADMELQRAQADRLQKLLDHQQTNNPGPNDKDSFASTTIELQPGETATVTVEPNDGYNLRVKEAYFDRRTDHSYTINVGGDVNSVSHRAKYAKPKSVRQSDRVTAEVTNNSGSATVVDFELIAWAEPGA